MPNWCQNNLRIRGNGEKVMEVLAILKDDDGNVTFNNVAPLPEELRGTTAPTPDDVPEEERKRLKDKYGADNWYDWQIKNWGCKWDASESNFWEEDGDPIVSFQTPWGPPIEFIRKLSKLFKNMTFEIQFADESEHDAPIGGAEIKDGCVEYYGPEAATPEATLFGVGVWEGEWMDA